MQRNTRVQSLIEQMTLDEKISLLSGADTWRTPAIERLNIPSMKMTDGPNGARGDAVSSATAACFPVGSALAATFNVDLIREIGVALGQETKSKQAQVLLGPTINLHRTPLGGRNFECYSEDPHLTSRLAVAFTHGVQSEGVSVCLKHFICNDSEFERHTMSSDVDERTLRELYLLPFEAGIKEAEAKSVMSSYNRVNGGYVASSTQFLDDILRGDWGFDGFVVSDWGGARETVGNALAGMDLEMPGPARTRGQKLKDAIGSGDVEESHLDSKLTNILSVMEWSGRLDDPSPEPPEVSEDRPEHRALARRAAQESMVLLKNDHVLPFSETKLNTLAVIGPNAERGQIQGGGSSGVKPHYRKNPLEAICERGQELFEVTFEPGCQTHRYAPAFTKGDLTAASDPSRFGLSYALFDNGEFSGEPLEQGIRQSPVLHFGAERRRVDGRNFSVRFEGVFNPDVDGPHTFGLLPAGRAKLFIDDELVVDNWSQQEPSDAFYGHGSAEKLGTLTLTKGGSYRLRIDYACDEKSFFPAVRYGVLKPQPSDLAERAVGVAQKSDAVILIVGTNSDWETEGNDRTDLALPGAQNELIEAVLDANPNTVVVVNAGSVVAMPWADKAGAILFTWFAGQEFGNALCDLIFGNVSPSGKLPLTFPQRLEDTPAFTNYPGELGHVRYGEGLYIGHRWYDARDIEPRFAFGHGLTYANFSITDLRVPSTLEEETTRIEIDVVNHGNVRARDVVQIYVSDLKSSLHRPLRELKGFKKIELGPGDSQTVAIDLAPRAFAFWHPEYQSFIVEPGAFEIHAGFSSRDLRLRVRTEWTGNLLKV